MTTHVERLALHASSMRSDALPAHVRQRIDSFLLYNLAVALAGYDPDDLTWAAIQSLPRAPGPSTIIGSGERASAADAAFSNAALITARGQNDTLKDIHGHLGCVVIPAALAAAQYCGASLNTVRAAVAAGYEVQAHAGSIAATAAVERGFRATSVFGVLGAAAASARALNLSTDQSAHALAIACSFASGVMQCWEEGSMEWRLQVAHASRSGLIAAFLAKQGMTGASRALEGSVGLYRALGATSAELDLSHWKLENVTFKPYPGCAINQGPVHALLCVLDKEDIASDAVRSVEVRLTPAQAAYPGVANRGPFATAAGAVMSAAFMVSAALRDRALRQSHFTSEYADPALLAACSNVSVKPEPLPHGSSRVVINLRDGRQLEARCVDQESFVFDWDQTVRLATAVGRETRSPQGSCLLAGLVQRIGDGTDSCVDDLLTLCVLP